jgi:hypothetical protein
MRATGALGHFETEPLANGGSPDYAVEPMRDGEPISPGAKNAPLESTTRCCPRRRLWYVVVIGICISSIIGLALLLLFWKAPIPGAATDVGDQTGCARLDDKYEGLQLWVRALACPAAAPGRA